MINIVCTSKPCDGLFYYSYEYMNALQQQGISSRVVVVCHRRYKPEDYDLAIKEKYTICNGVEYDNFIPKPKDVTLVLGRSMITLAYKDFDSYTTPQQTALRELFGGSIISVYSQNHPQTYPRAIEFFYPDEVIDLCDREVYPNGIGEHFEKIINFDIYKPYRDEKDFKYLFLGTNEKYYARVEQVIDSYTDHGILVYNDDYINPNRNNIFVPVDNIIGKFDTYVYTKNYFDPAPRLLQECKYYNKPIIYKRDKNLIDGGSVYWKRPIKTPDCRPILDAYDRLHKT